MQRLVIEFEPTLSGPPRVRLEGPLLQKQLLYDVLDEARRLVRDYRQPSAVALPTEDDVRLLGVQARGQT